MRVPEGELEVHHELAGIGAGEERHADEGIESEAGHASRRAKPGQNRDGPIAAHGSTARSYKVRKLLKPAVEPQR